MPQELVDRWQVAKEPLPYSSFFFFFSSSLFLFFFFFWRQVEGRRVVGVVDVRV